MKKKIIFTGVLVTAFLVATNVYAVGTGVGASGQAEPKGIHEPGTGLENPELKEENQGTGQALQNANAVNQETSSAGMPVQQQTQERLRDGSATNSEPNQVRDRIGNSEMSSSTNGGGRGLKGAEQRRSAVASAVQAMLQVADRNGGIGQQVKEIAQAQTQNQEKLEAGLTKVQSRNKLAKFFVGPNYGEINNSEKLLEQNQEQIAQLNQLKAQITNEGDAQELANQIQVLEQTNAEIQNSLNQAQEGFSLFGWAFKLFAK